MYAIRYSKEAEDYLAKRSTTDRERIIKAIERLRIRPGAFVQRLVGSPYSKFRVGDYRVIVHINEGILTVLVVDVGHRKNIYKR